MRVRGEAKHPRLQVCVASIPARNETCAYCIDRPCHPPSDRQVSAEAQQPGQDAYSLVDGSIAACSVRRHNALSIHIIAWVAGLTTNGVAHSPSVNGSSVSSTVVDPQLLQVLQNVAAGGLQPEAAARHLRELGAGYQQVMDFAQVKVSLDLHSLL